MKKLEIIFDFDGTLADTMPILFEFLESHPRYSERYLALKVSSIEKFRRMTAKALMKELGLSTFELISLLKQFFDHVNENIEKLQPFDKVAEQVKILSRDHTLGILSSNQPKLIERFVQINQMDHFDYIKGGASIFSKQKKLQNLLNKRGLSVHQAVYIGDEIRDIEAARGAGIPIISASWGFNDPVMLKRMNPDLFAEAPGEIPYLVRKIEEGKS